MEVGSVIDRGQLYRGLSQAAWGYFLLLLNFNLTFNNTISINLLPSFAGALLLLSATGSLSAERRDLKLLRPLCGLLAAWHLIDWVLNLVGLSVSGRFLYLDLAVGAASLYFHFQFLTDMAALAEKYQPPDSDLNRRIRRRRTVLLILDTALELASSLVQFIGTEQQAVATLVWAFLALVVLLVVVILIMRALFELRRYVRDMPEVMEE